jgi:hypothetical protein
VEFEVQTEMAFYGQDVAAVLERRPLARVGQAPDVAVDLQQDVDDQQFADQPWSFPARPADVGAVAGSVPLGAQQ